MKKKILVRLILILSLGFNAAAVIYFLQSPKTVAANAAPDLKTIPMHLTDQQKKEIEPLRLEFHRKNQTIKKEITARQKELLAALDEEHVDITTVNRCIDTINQLQKKIQLNAAEEIIRMKKIMNPRQCTCMIKNLGHAMDKSNQPCTCTHCNQKGKR